MAQSYQKRHSKEQGDEVQDALEACVQEGARKMLVAALEEEVDGFLERARYQRSKEFRGYRNGYHPVPGVNRWSWTGQSASAQGG